MARTATVIPFTKPRPRRRKPRLVVVNAVHSRAVFQLQRALKGLSYKEMVDGTNASDPNPKHRTLKDKRPVCTATVKKWWTGETLYPREYTMSRVLAAHGLKMVIANQEFHGEFE
jgi:hypothetical protein